MVLRQRDSRKIIVIAGDVTMDWNIARLRQGDHPKSSWNADDTTRAHWQRGGAALLADLVEAIARELERNSATGYRILQTSAPMKAVLPGDDRYHHSYALWSAFDQETKPGAPKVWRVAEFMGLDRRKDANGAPDWQKVKDDTDAADIVILDDADLGFRNSRELWPKAIGSGKKPWIILKMARPIAEGDLWQHLQKNHAERLIVVMAVDDLRLSEVQISRGLSWERTAQDLVWELVHNPRVNGLARCAHVVVSFDTAGAISLSRSSQPAARQTQSGGPKATLYFDPKVTEGGWQTNFPGQVIGYTSCLTAAIASRLMLDGASAEIGIGVRRGLAAMRTLHREGFGPAAEAVTSGPGFPVQPIVRDLASMEPKGQSAFVDVEVRDPMEPIAGQTDPRSTSTAAGFWTILGDRHTGSLARIAEQIVLDGPERALKGVPLGRFGNLLTVDRREIESFQSIRSLVREYASARRPGRPLNIAVFGAPGSGKSFGVAQVAQSLLGKGEIEKLTFNLSQFAGPDQLHDALHQVRDAGLSGKLPLVFWDEFDASLNRQELGWLAQFLAPMQDGAFQQGQITHAIGRAIFVFAGGTKETMEEFDRGSEDQAFRNAKGPDFVSRLKGYVNVLGANPRAGKPERDSHYLVRRAILLRSILERDARQLFTRMDAVERLNIDSGVLRALLHIGSYKHGVRSIESVIAMSELSGAQRFKRSCLPAAPQLDLHVDSVEFQSLVQRIELEGELLERLAAAAHEVFCDGLRKKGHRRGDQTSERRKTHRFLVAYSKLPEEEKAQNRGNVRDIPAKLASAGYVMVPARSNEEPFNFPGADLETLAEAEHDRWMKEKIRAGYRWGARSDPEKKTHKDLLPWRKFSAAEIAARYTPAEAAALGRKILPEKEKAKDRDLIKGIPRILARAGFTIVALDSARS